MRKRLLTLIVLGLLHSFVLGGQEKPKLNVIVIFCDDLGFGELPVYRKLYQESEEFKTASVPLLHIWTDWQGKESSAPEPTAKTTASRPGCP